MKRLYQFSFLLLASLVFGLAVWLDHSWLMAISLSCSFLMLAFMKERLESAQARLMEAARAHGGMPMEQNGVYLPFSTSERAVVLKGKKQGRLVKILDHQFTVRPYRAFAVNEEVKPYEVESKYVDYLLVSRFAMMFTILLSFGYAGYQWYQHDTYDYAVLALVVAFVQGIGHWRVMQYAWSRTASRLLYRNDEYLHQLMRLYGIVILELELEELNPTASPVDTGSWMVQYRSDADSPYYQLTVRDFMALEELAYDLKSQQKETP